MKCEAGAGPQTVSAANGLEDKTMAEKDIEKRHYKTFEEIKQINKIGQEFWWARDLQPVLEYGSWDKFTRIIEKAVIACKNAEQDADDHFSQVGKLVKIGSGAEREIQDFALSRYACYLIVQNGDPYKPVITVLPQQ